MENFKLNERLKLAFNYLFYTGRNVFLTGKAGTGKTTFLKQLRLQSPKRMIVTSPTGVAAVNAGGVTLHSFFQLPFGVQIPGTVRKESYRYNFQKMKIEIIRSLELLVIDEISMVRADLLDSVDAVLRRYRGNEKPFGGVQMLLIGDMQQLSPVVRPEDEELLRPYYNTHYFFGSHAWQKTDYVCIELNEVFRQSDADFISILNEIRESKANQSTIERLNRQYRPDFQPPEGEDIVTLVTTNSQADRINNTHLLALKTPVKTFTAEVSGEFPESAFPVEKTITFKKDSVVMFLKNDPSQEKRFYNGKIGRITGFDEGVVIVRCSGESEEIRVAPLEWENTKYTLNPETKEITEEIIGTFKQIPLKTAWAVTIHKSQGLTFDKLMIDASNSFAHGQVYVALSRCRTLDGLILLKPLQLRDLIYDSTVNSFSKTVEEKIPDNAVWIKDKRDYFFDTIGDLFDFYPLFNALKSEQRQLDMAGSSVVGNFAVIKGLDSVVYENFIAVSEKFMHYVRANYAAVESPEKDEVLLTRICNGCKYYLEKIETLLDAYIGAFEYLCDDKTISEKLDEATETLFKVYIFKREILKFCLEGFVLTKYYSQKAKLLLPEEQKKIAAEKPQKPRSKILENLLAWRAETADKYGVDEREIVASRTLQAVADKKPYKTSELVSIKGMGGKSKRFAAEILKVLQISGVEVDAHELSQAEFESLSTQEKTLYMLNAGMLVNEIASERKLNIETVMGHLAKFVAEGTLEAELIMDSDRLKELADLIRKEPQKTDKQIVTDSKFSYGEIKIARAYLERQED